MMKASMIRAVLGLLAAACTVLGAGPAAAQDTAPARAALEQAAEAMGGLDRLRGLDNVVMTGFGQRVYYDGGGFITGDEHAPPKWISVTDAQRTFDLANHRALNQERRSMQFPFAGFFGLDFKRNASLQTGSELLDHPLPALLAALDPATKLGSVTTDEGAIVVEFTIPGSRSPAWIGIDPRTHLPKFTRWISGHPNLGEVTTTAWFTGYLPFGGVQLPMGLMNQMDWRNQTSLMFQVDSYRLNLDEAQLPVFPAPAPAPAAAPVTAKVTRLADGVWDVRTGTAGGPVIEFARRLVMFEAYGGEAQTLARIDAANKLVPGKKVEAVIVTHHHFDHTGGIRAAVSRGLEVISKRGNEGIIREMVTRPAVYYPDALARNPHDLAFTPVDEKLVLEDPVRRLEIYHTLEHSHMPDGVFAYLPKERIMMEGDFGDEAWQLHFWGGALAANIKHYGIDPLTDVSVHGSGPLTIAQTLANDQKQIDAAKEWCRTTQAGGRYAFGCPVQYDTTGPVPLEAR
ncbi:MBL fold metallo-hydrolase [Croceibacterium aestuarii]|uniref:MBL fold metallo-hydrolase n=1 Tax=Croceibacterium aestuarii TaxID=3064139 RepID=UPI00272DF853|nr:MBL fold metallo-hydrolase [Croceibacterium sp. D39]